MNELGFTLAEGAVDSDCSDCRVTGKGAPGTRLDFYRADLDDWLAIGVVGDVADNLLGLRPPCLNKCVDGLEVKVTHGEIGRRRSRDGPSDAFFNRDILKS